MADLKFAVRVGLSEMRAVDAQYRYSMKPGKAGSWDITAEQVAELHRAATAEAVMKFLPAVRSGKMTLKEVEPQIADAVWRKVSKSVGWIYRREKW